MNEENLIKIPVAIVEENLTTSELGTLVVLMASPHLSWAAKQLWQTDKTFSKDLVNLQKQDIIRYNEHGNITINFGVQKDIEGDTDEHPEQA